MSEPIRVLHVVTYMGCGGLETMLMNYYRHIDRTKVQFDFLTHRKERHEYDDEIERLGGVIYRLPRLNPWSPGYHSALNNFFRDHREYKIVHSHIDCMSGIPLKAAKEAGIPVRIAHSHSNGQDKNFKYILKLYYKRNIPNVATQLFACSEAAGKWMFGNHEFTVLPNAIDIGKYTFDKQVREEVRKQFGLTDELVVGHVGRFSAVKNHEFLLDLFEKIYQKNGNSKLLLVGGGSLEDELKTKAHQMRIEENVIFAGIRSDVANCMQAMDVFVLPSLYEGLGIVAIEAQAAGLPCCLSDTVSREAAVTDLAKFYTLKDGADAWAKWVCDCSQTARKDTSDDLREKGYDIESATHKIQDFYENVVRNCE